MSVYSLAVRFFHSYSVSIVFSYPKSALNLDRDMEVALESAVRAGRVIKDGYGKVHSDEEGSISEIVSEIDESADLAVHQYLKETRPDDPILSEELNPETSNEKDRLWIVDPLDGTAAFLFETGEDIPSVMIALRKGDVTHLGVVFFPLTGEWFYAVKGKGAFKDGRKLLTWEGHSDLGKAWIVMNHYTEAQYETENFKRIYNGLRSSSGVRMLTVQVPDAGSAVRVVEGRKKLSALIHDNGSDKVKQGPWDVAANQIIVEEAGGVFWNARGESYDSFNPEPIIIAASEGIGRSILDLL